MKLNYKTTLKGFTIIELMVSIFVTLIVLGTFFKLYTNSFKNERSTNLRTSVAHVGDQIAESLSAPLRLIGLNNDYADYDAGQVIINADGGTGNDTITFRFKSPYGGPITKLKANASGTGPDCSFTTLNSGSFHSGVTEIQLMTSSGIYKATNLSLSYGTNTITGKVWDSSGAAFGEDCSLKFPEGTLVTGGNNTYLFYYSYGGANTTVRLTNETSGEDVIDFDNDAKSPFSVPWFVLQFQREYILSDILHREWVSEITASTEIKEIKAIRFGFVMLSTRERTQKKDVSSGSGTVNLCHFETTVTKCYHHNDLNKTAYVFRRLIHIKNFDYLQRNSGISY